LARLCARNEARGRLTGDQHRAEDLEDHAISILVRRSGFASGIASFWPCR
jgi:hypothetical protein